MNDYIERLPNWARWIIALPAALLCSWLGRAVAVFCYQWWNGGESFWSYITGTAAETIIFVYVLYEIIPNYKFICSVIVNVLLGGLLLFLTLYAIYKGTITIDGSVGGLIINNAIMLGILIYYSVMLYKAEHPYRFDNSQTWD